ncbi:MAG TPA: RNA polymerase sigma-70 factor [Thermoanaerobaculia bacterium]|nr:RNA polymerase sigma-70 factor [Thermoanaerobaculia bacterium]
MSDHDSPETVSEQTRARLFALAYRMLGSVAEAEDVVQESLLRLHRARLDGTVIDSPPAFLTAVATRLAIDHLRSARVRRETYVGAWLPEPLLTDAATPAADHAEMAESLSMAFLLLLERLSPVERAVFLLREVFDYEYGEIAAIVKKSEDNCRQIFARAKRRIEEGKPRFEPSMEKREELAGRFFAACESGSLENLVALLASDAVFIGDGGGKATAVREPLAGADRIAKLMQGLFAKARPMGVSMRRLPVNGQPGAMFIDSEGGIVSVFTLEIADGVVRSIRGVVNPDKLTHLGPVSELARLRR